MTNSKNWLDKPVILGGHRKSGTTLLLSLFDSHPQLCVYPPDSGFFYAYYPHFDQDKYTPQEKKQRIIDRILQNFIDDLLAIDEIRGKAFPYENLKKDFLRLMESCDCTAAELLRTVIEAFHMSTAGNSQSTPVAWMEKTTSTEIYAADIFKWYPHAKMIHVLRDPRDNYGSLKSGWKARYQNMNDSQERLLQSLLDRCGLGLKLAKINEQCYGKDRYRVIRYEDLTQNPESTMRSLAEFIGIEYDPILLRPTYLGLAWKGNNFDGLKFDSASNVNVGRWKQRITEHEAQVIEFYLGRDMQDWGYAPVYKPGECAEAASSHYKWFNFAQQYSALTT